MTVWQGGLLLLMLLVLGVPLWSVAGSWALMGPAEWSIWQHLSIHVLPAYAWTTLWLCLGVLVGTLLLGVVTATLTTGFDFPGRRVLEWALVLPLAMPAYVTAYAYTDFLQYSGVAQTALRDWLGLQGRVLPEIRSLGGAMLIFSVSLYPYVYLLVRTSMRQQVLRLLEAAQVLGASAWTQWTRVVLPLARPAATAGAALALMETLSDFGVVSYFGLQTFTTGIYKAWLAQDNAVAALQLSTVLLVVVGLVLWLETQAQARMRFASTRHAAGGAPQPQRLQGRRAWAATALCAAPVLAGFVAPVAVMLHTLVTRSSDWVATWQQFAGWALNSAQLGVMAAILAVALALWLVWIRRMVAWAWVRAGVRAMELGYALPGAVVVVGLLWPLQGWAQAWPQWGWTHMVTGTVLGLLWAYLVRFVPVAMQSVSSGYSQVPHTLDDSAMLLGLSGKQVWQRVHWPLLRRSAWVAGLMVMVEVIKELPVTLVLRPFDHDTLAVMTYQLARDERLGEAALPALALVVVGLIPMVLVTRSLRAQPN
jgi:iron(III) transport system permease protein